jgi:hypothetical protein
MKTMPRISILGICAVLMLLMDVPWLHQLDDAEAIAGVRRRTARRTAVVVGGTAAATASAATAAANQQAAYSQQQAAAAQQEAAAAQQQAAASQAEAEAYKQQAAAAPPTPAPAPAPATGGALPIGTVVSALPAGCTTTTSGGVEYYSCGGNFYRAAFQGSQLVYVTAQP